MRLPRVSLGGLSVSRLIVGGNPFSGISHQTPELDRAMLDYYTTQRIHAVLRACEAVGITAFIGRADAHVRRMLREYWNDGGTIRWIAQTAPEFASHEANIKQAVAAGASAVFLHGGVVDQHHEQGEIAELERLLGIIHQQGVPAGIAAHYPAIHRELAERLPTDFHMVCCFQCGSIHSGKGHRFDLEDVPVALAAIQAVAKPCIAYKVLGAGRYDPRERLPEVAAGLKPTDAVLMGFYPERRPTEIEDAATLLGELLAEPAVAD